MNSNALATKLLLTVEPLKTVVQYVGTASASIPFPYGNQQHDDKAYVHLCPSSLQTVKTAVGKDIASNVFKTTVAAVDVKSALQPVRVRIVGGVGGVEPPQLYYQPPQLMFLEVPQGGRA